MGKITLTTATVAALLALLAIAAWYAAGVWASSSDGPPMPTAGYVAMALGIIFSLVIGCGLMALLFYSHRHGYDGPSEADRDNS